MSSKRTEQSEDSNVPTPATDRRGKRYRAATWHKAVNYARGLWYGRCFEKTGPLQIEGPIRIDIRYGILRSGKSVIWPRTRTSPCAADRGSVPRSSKWGTTVTSVTGPRFMWPIA